MKKSELRQLIREELKKLGEAKKPKKDTPEYHEHQIAIDTVKNPKKGVFMGGLTPEEAEKTLKKKFGYSDEEIEKLKSK